MSRLFAIVEIDGPLFLIIGGVFIVVFVVVSALAYLLLAKGKSTQSGWHLNFEAGCPYRSPLSSA